MRCVCPTSHDDVSPITYIDTDRYRHDGTDNPYFDKVMVSHLVCRKCNGNICVSTMTIHEYYMLAARKCGCISR